MNVRLPGSTTDGSRQAILMGAGLLAMGVLHFVVPENGRERFLHCRSEPAGLWSDQGR